MKQTFLFIMSLMLISTNCFADGLTATLQQGEKMIPFYGVNAFKQAYEAADSGSVITLSAGNFNTIDGFYGVAKPIKIVGNFGMSSTSIDRTILSNLIISANKVTIDGIYFSKNVTLGKIEDCKIVHSWIEGTLDSNPSGHFNTIVDQCVVKEEKAIKNGKNYTIKNSTIGKFGAYNTSTNIAYITNCVIYNFVCDYSSVSSNPNGTPLYPTIPIAIYKNNVLGIDVTCYKRTYGSVTYHFYNVYFNSPSEFYHNVYAMTYFSYSGNSYFSYNGSRVYYDPGCQFANNSHKTRDKVISGSQYPAVLIDPGYGQDGTLRGPGGGTGFSSYPSIPRITSKTIDSNTDAEGKLNVKITVKAQ